MTERKPRLRIVQSDAPAEAAAAEPLPSHTELEHALEAARQSPEVRRARVEALKAAIASGAYEPDPREIARKILEHGL